MTKTRYTAGFRTRPAAPRAAGLRDTSGTSTASGQATAATVLPESHFDVVVENDKTMLKLKDRYAGLYTTGFLSARGKDDSAGAGGGGSSLEEVWASLKTNTDAYKDTLIDVAHIPSLTISKVTGLQDALDGKLSSSDFSKAQWAAIDSGINDILVDKLTGIETGAQVNILESVKLNSTALSVSDKAVNINAVTSIAVPTGLSAGTLTSAGKITLSLSSGYVIPKESRLSTIESTLSGKANAATTLSGYGITDAYTSDEVDALLDGKADTSHKHSAADITSGVLSIDRIPTIPYSKTSGVQSALVSGTSIKTINGVSILGSGNIVTPDTTYSSKAAASGGTDLSLVTTGEKYTWNAKQAAISDLSTIRSNATDGAAAYGWGDHSKAGYLKSIANLVINGTVYDGTSTVTITTPTYTLASFGITASATELNYTKGVTSAIQTQLNAKANSSALGNYLPLSGGTMSGHIVLGTTGNAIMGANEFAGGMLLFTDGRTVVGSLGTSTTNATLIRSKTGHVLCGDASKQYAMLDSGNYNTYSPSLTGTGASGTWGINVSGTAKALTLNNHTYAQCPTIGDLKSSLIANMAAGGDINYPVQSYNFQGSNSLSLKNNWATDSYAVGDGSRTSFMRLDRYASDKYGAFLMSGMSIDPLAGLSRLTLYNSEWYGPYLLLDEANYSFYALPLTGGTISGELTVAGNVLHLGNSASANLYMWRPGTNYIWATKAGGNLCLGTQDAGNTAINTSAVWISGQVVNLGGATSRYRSVNVKSGISIQGSTNPLIDFRNSSYVTVGYVQATDAGWMSIGPGNDKGLFIGTDGALTINATPPTTPTGNSIDAPKAIHSTTGVYSEGYVSARGVDSSSDESLKTDIKPLANALDYILGTKYHTFKWKSDGKPCVGVIAQEELGREHGYLVEKHNGFYSYNYAATTALLGAALQEEDDKVERLKARIAALEAELERLKYNS